LWCLVNCGTSSILVGVCYRSPSSTVDNNNQLLETFRKACSLCANRHILIMGDFNYPEISYTDNNVSTGPEAAPNRFYETTQDLFLSQYITEPTRYREGAEPSVLDYVFMNEEDLIENVTYEEPLGKSDHVVLTWSSTVSVDSYPATQQHKKNYWKGNYGAINKELAKVDWKEEFTGHTVEEKWKFFRDTIINLVQKFIPDKKERQRKKNPWIRKATVDEMKIRGTAWRDYRENPCKSKYRQYTTIRNKVNKMVHEDRDSYNHKMLDSFQGNPKKFYGFLNSQKTVKQGVLQLTKKDGTLTTSDRQVAQTLCDFFGEVFTKEVDKSDPVMHTAIFGAANKVELFFDTCSVKQRLTRLRTDKSAGPNGLHPMVLKECAENLAMPLANIFQSSYNEEQLPSDWKLAEVTPIYKKGPKNDTGNYRPISLTSIACKVMEGLMRDELLKFLDANNIITSKQHGFVRGRSCLTNLLQTFEEWTTALDEGQGIDVIYLDYRKAFDTVPHGRLIPKLSDYGVSEGLLGWIQSFLGDRRMRVNIRGNFSEWIDVISGVPQGSVIGPLLFLCYVNDIPDWMLNSIILFADDIKVWTRINNSQDSTGLQDDLDTLQQWTDRWLLGFNIPKCRVMHIGHSEDTKYNLKENGIPVELAEIKQEKDLGVVVTSDLKPSQQCKTAATKARGILGWIYRHFKKLSQKQFLIIYKAYVRPHLEYSVQAWSPYLQKDIKCLESVQRRATKMIHGFNNLSYSQRLQRLNLTTLEARRVRGDLIETYKLLHNIEKVDYKQFFALTDNVHNLRGHNMRLVKTRNRLQLRQNFFSQRVINHWNSLTQEAVAATSVNSFKNNIQNYIRDMGI